MVRLRSPSLSPSAPDLKNIILKHFFESPGHGEPQKPNCLKKIEIFIFFSNFPGRSGDLPGVPGDPPILWAWLQWGSLRWESQSQSQFWCPPRFAPGPKSGPSSLANPLEPISAHPGRPTPVTYHHQSQFPNTDEPLEPISAQIHPPPSRQSQFPSPAKSP